ncbi:MAG: glycosyltransferase WbuB [Microbacterium sp. 67-17]|uniref:glycosyltransferase family 4 protein n=1 Tax=Microbacterium sp. 67-17 TaxID=1895782 RepID=UPI00095FF457|nr:glycosyltransferase family 4 protein [Microbacterium sp. 67-17]OJV98173.1 MAG: glycosyltransferase WbuB [Microbacterium sp. 67-17]
MSRRSPDSSPRVLVVGINYPPEHTGIAPYTGSMSRGLARRGIAARVITAHPHYPDWKIKPGYGQWSRSEHLDGVAVKRVRHYVPNPPKGARRLASEVSFGARSTVSRWGSPDAIVVVSPAMISSAMAALRAKALHRSAPLIVWVQDLYARGMVETGQGGRAAQGLAAIEGRLLRSADRVVVIHDRFADIVARDFGVDRDRIIVVRNWTHLAPFPPIDVAATRKRFRWKPDETVVLHTGNMGVKQGLENVIDAARVTEHYRDPVRFVLVGDGGEREKLQELARGVAPLQFVPPLDDADYAAALKSADILLVNELAGVAEMAVPSKLTSYFQAERPVIAATDPSGITAAEVRAADAGLVVPAGDPEALRNAALELRANPDRATRFGVNGLHYRQTVLEEETAITKFADMLYEVTMTGDHPA